ncbi:MAG: hypothetical protein OEZ02_05690 [Anaerolineae bacterium]|nr:hypothetical protein [Anaerolineae bacterium]
MTACGQSSQETPADQPVTAVNTRAAASLEPESTLGEGEGDEADLTQADAIQLSQPDPCLYATQEQIEQVLAAAVTETIPADSDTLRSCTYVSVPGEQFVTIAVYQGEAAKLYFLDEIAQLQEDCSLSYSYSTNADNPTPLPPAVQSLGSNSLVDLFVMDLELQSGCGGSYQALTELGSNVYTFQTFIRGAVVGIAYEDLYVTFLYADAGKEADQALAVVKALIELVFLP